MASSPSDSRFRRADAILAAILELPAGERRLAIAERCAGDAELAELVARVPCELPESATETLDQGRIAAHNTKGGRACAMIALARARRGRRRGAAEGTMEGTAVGAQGYRVDGDGFLVDFADWDESFAESMAPSFGIAGGLTPKHWEVIHYIRRTFVEYGQCPLVYHTCKANGLRIRDLQTLFPSGYLRGACRLAGVTYKQGYHGSGSLPAAAARPVAAELHEAELAAAAKTYTVDVRGFLIDPGQWDEAYAAHRAAEMKAQPLTDTHWKVLRFLRDRHAESGVVPTIYETCTSNGLELEDMERLFPDGYHRGAVKLAGLRVL